MPHRGEQALLVIVWAMLYRVLRVSARLHFSNEQMETINQMTNRLLVLGLIKVFFLLTIVARRAVVYSYLAITNEVLL